MTQIATYVFMDTETSGSEKTRRNMDNIRITEISLVAVKREHLLMTEKGSMPRVLNKITLCLNPLKEIQQSCVQVSGLTNELLENESPFDENVINIINTFLNMLTKPVCLIAQNGFHWDFPILKRNLGKTALSNKVLSTDSLFAFYDILNTEKILNENKTDSLSTACTEAKTNDNLKNDNDMKTYNEGTPEKCTVFNNKIPEKPTSEGSYYFKVKYTFPWGVFSNKPKESYKLTNIYSKLYGVEPSVVLHQAENDTMVLLECAIAVKEKFVDWVDSHHDYFSVISPMPDTLR